MPQNVPVHVLTGKEDWELCLDVGELVSLTEETWRIFIHDDGHPKPREIIQESILNARVPAMKLIFTNGAAVPSAPFYRLPEQASRALKSSTWRLLQTRNDSSSLTACLFNHLMRSCSGQ